MAETIIVLVPILAADIINVTLFAFMVYAAGGEKPILTSSALLCGHMLAYFLTGIGLAYSLDYVSAFLENPNTIDFLIGLAIGVLLIWIAYKSTAKPTSAQSEPGSSLTPISAFKLGLIVNFIGAPFALPYFAAIDQILKADLNFASSLLLLLGYNIVYALPFAMIPITVALLGEESRRLLQRANAFVERIAVVITPLILGAVGLFLIADAARYFLVGEGLF